MLCDVVLFYELQELLTLNLLDRDLKNVIKD